MSKGYLLIDGSNVGHVAAAGKVLSVGEVQTHAVLGFLKMLRGAVTRFPGLAPIVLWDGRSWRKDVLAGYKASRDKPVVTVHDERTAEARAAFKAQRPLIVRALNHLGVTQMLAVNLEADDLAGLLVKRYASKAQILMLTGDRDWITLVGPKVAWLDPVVRNGKVRRVNTMNFEEEMGVKTGRAYLDCKALMGDTSDEIPGVGGIGEKGAKDLVNKYGSVVDFFNATLTDKDLPKKYLALAQESAKQEIYYRNIALMDLQHPSIPTPVGMRITKGEFSTEGFAALCRELLFNSILTDIDGWTEPFHQRVFA